MTKPFWTSSRVRTIAYTLITFVPLLVIYSIQAVYIEVRDLVVVSWDNMFGYHDDV